jgi:hypothetical protein
MKKNRQFLALALDIGCIACWLDGRPDTPSDLHHPTGASRKRLGDRIVVPLCAWHHRAIKPVESLSYEETERVMGPSLARGSKAFYERYGTEQELLRHTENLMASYNRSNITLVREDEE